MDVSDGDHRGAYNAPFLFMRITPAPSFPSSATFHPQKDSGLRKWHPEFDDHHRGTPGFLPQAHFLTVSSKARVYGIILVMGKGEGVRLYEIE